MTEAQIRAGRENPDLFIEAFIRRSKGLPLTLKETGILLGLPANTVRSAEARAIPKLRAALQAKGAIMEGWTT